MRSDRVVQLDNITPTGPKNGKYFIPGIHGSAFGCSCTDRGEAGARIRRIDCASGGCSVGCGSDEMAISAFCTVGSYPTINADQSVRCSNSAGVEWPTVLF